MSHGPTYYPTKGACIYCGAVDKELTDEHIVPLALGGQHVIRKASCHSCAIETSKFERKVARELWGDARVSFDAPSRRKASRPEFILMPDATNPNKSIPVPAKEYPAGLVFYEMAPPGILQGLGENIDISKLWKLVMVDDDKRREEFLKKYPVKLSLKFKHVPTEFGRLLAKIGYGQVLTSLDLGDFNPICLPYIMGQKPNVSYVVGGTGEKSVPIPESGYYINTSVEIVTQQSMLLLATVRLYANTHAPSYQVAAGEVIGRDNITRVLGKLGLLNQ